MKNLLLTLMLSMALIGCATQAVNSPTQSALLVAKSVLRDAQFSGAQPPDLGDDPFALSPAMQIYLRDKVARRARSSGPRNGLYESLSQDLVLRYEGERTLSAQQAFAERRGNCVSLVLMTAALAKALDMPLRYHSVLNQEVWSHNAEIAFLSGHINVTLEAAASARNLNPQWDRGLTIDFMPTDRDKQSRYLREIDERTVLAMYYNNRAAESLVAADVQSAYWWARAALLSDPHFNASYNTLGVVYRKNRLPELAEAAFRTAVEREPSNVLAISNLAGHLETTGRASEAAALKQKYGHLSQWAPYQLYQVGLAALKAKDLPKAKQAFETQLRATPYDHDVLFALGMTNLHLGHTKKGQRLLEQALVESTTQSSRNLYSAKLQLLKRLQEGEDSDSPS